MLDLLLSGSARVEEPRLTRNTATATSMRSGKSLRKLSTKPSYLSPF